MASKGNQASSNHTFSGAFLLGLFQGGYVWSLAKSFKRVSESNVNSHDELKKGNHALTLVFQIPFEDRCLDPQTPPEVRSSGVLNTDPHKV